VTTGWLKRAIWRRSEEIWPAQLHSLACQERALHHRRGIAGAQDVCDECAVASLEAVEARSLREHAHARGLRVTEDLGVLPADALHEVQTLEHVGEPIGLEDHRHHVGRFVLVARSEVRRQQPCCAVLSVLQSGQVIARRDHAALNGGQLCLACVEVRLQRRQACLRFANARARCVDSVGFGRDRRAQLRRALRAR
jgi:hypothetical protein